MTEDVVNHPPHYRQYPVEAIDIIEWVTSKCKDPTEGYLIGTVMKYILRYNFKNGVEDLKKARWFLDRLIERLENDK